MSVFKTITNQPSGEYKEKGSKFIGVAFHVRDEAEVKLRLEELRKQYYDARHHCYAYVLGMSDQRYRANDDGEPGHSAGDPILGQIRSFELTDALVVVVRYFGGTKLGVSGLIHAYKTAAEEALGQAETIEIYEKNRFKLTYSYDQTSLVERVLADFDIEYVDRQFTEECLVIFDVKKETTDVLSAKLTLNELNFEQLD